MNLLIVIASAVADLVKGAFKVAAPKRAEKPKTKRQRHEDRWLAVAVTIGLLLVLGISWLLHRG